MASLDPADISVPIIIAGLLATILLFGGVVADAYVLAMVVGRKVRWRERIQLLHARPWHWHDGVYLMLVLGTLFATMILGAQIMQRCCIILSDNGERILMLSETVLMQVVAIATIEHLRRRHQRSCSEGFSIQPLSAARVVGQGVLFYLAMMPPIILAALATNLVLRHFGVPVESQDILKGFADPAAPYWFRVYLIILAIACAPVVEELVFRGIALPIAARRASPTVAIVLVSLLFAVVHGHLPAMAPLFVVAVCLSLGYICSGTVLVPMIMHALFNTINLIIFHLSYDISQL